MKDKKQQVKPAVMDATGKSDFDTTGKGTFLGTMDTSAVEGMAPRNQGSLRPMGGAVEDPRMAVKEDATNEHLQKLFGGENLSEEFMNKASVIFEAAVSEKVENIRELVLQESAKLLEEEVNKTVNELATRLDEYLNYVVEEWMKDNKLAVESGIRTEIAESFIGGLKKLFETHYVEVPEAKHDVLEDLFNENAQLEEHLNEQIKVNVDLKRDIVAGQARAIFLETISDMSQVDAERLATLAESIDFSNSDDFKSKLTIIKENYLKAAPIPAQDMETLTEQKDHTQVTDGPMSVYLNTVARQVKKF